MPAHSSPACCASSPAPWSPSDGPDGLPTMREALALAYPDERGEISLELGRALFTHGHFADACTALEAGRRARRRAAPSLRDVAVLDLSLVRALRGARRDRRAGARLARGRLDPTLRARGGGRARRAGRRDCPRAGRRRRWWRCSPRGATNVPMRVDRDRGLRAGGGEFDTLRMAVALRAMVRLRAGRVADVEADLRGLIEWVAELELPLRAYRTALPSVISPLSTRCSSGASSRRPRTGPR